MLIMNNSLKLEVRYAVYRDFSEPFQCTIVVMNKGCFPSCLIFEIDGSIDIFQGDQAWITAEFVTLEEVEDWRDKYELD